VIGAVVFAVVIGSVMALIYRKEEKAKAKEQLTFPDIPEKRPVWQTALHFFTLVIILVFANWGKPGDSETDGIWYWIWSNKWLITSAFGLVLAFTLFYVLKIKWQWVLIAVAATAASGIIFTSPLIPVIVAITGLSLMTLFDHNEPENKEWTIASWEFAKQIMPLLALGVIVAGFLLGSTHDDVQIPGIIPGEWIAALVGGNSLFSNFFASVVGAFMYFATLTEVPILQGLLASGMGKGPALALLLAGPSLSLPNILVINSVLGTQKTIIYVSLVVIMATISGLIFGAM
jgi:uncharacterized protein